MVDRYGVPNAAHSKDIQDRKKLTIQKKYGVDHISKSSEIKDKKKQTMLDRWGVENPSQNQEIQQRKIDTNQERYGVDWAPQSLDIREKQKQTTLANWGYLSNLSNPDVRARLYATMMEKYGVRYPQQNVTIQQNTMATNLKKYGVTHAFQNPQIRAKIQETNRKRYGSYSWRASDIGKKTLSDLHMKLRGYPNPAQDPVVKQKIRDAFMEKYGVVHPNYVGMSDETIEILRSPEMFAEAVSGLTVLQAAAKLSVDQSTIYRLSAQYQCRNQMLVSDNSYELKIIQVLEEWNIPYVRRCRTVIEPQELDIWIPSKNIAVEVGSAYWHSEIFGRGKYYHFEKWQRCHDKGITLFQWFDDDLDKHWDLTKARLLRSLGIAVEVVGARKVTIGDCTVDQERDFLNKWHAKGFSNNRNATISATYHGEIVAILTIERKKQVAIIDRWATDISKSWPGLYSRMLKHWIMQTGFQGQLQTWCDNRLGNGKVYQSSGFQKIRVSKPGYWYLRNNGLEHRMKFQRHKLARLFDIDTANMSEWIIMQSQGYDRVWDAGHTLWCKQV